MSLRETFRDAHMGVKILAWDACENAPANKEASARVADDLHETLEILKLAFEDLAVDFVIADDDMDYALANAERRFEEMKKKAA